MLFLTEDLYIDHGAHKKVYLHPENSSLCIKILIKTPDWDFNKEMKYRKSRTFRNLSSKILPKYYGPVNTNLGTGYIFERILDYDNKTSITMDEYLRKLNISDTKNLYRILLDFRKALLEEKLLLTNMYPVNFMLQKIVPNEVKIRVVDNIGSANHLPLAFFIDFLAENRIKRYWNRFIDWLYSEYTSNFDWNLLKTLKF